MKHFIISVVTIMVSMSSLNTFAADARECSDTLFDLIISNDQKVKTSILCRKGDEYFRKCVEAFVENNMVEAALKFAEYVKEAEYAKSSEQCQ